MKKLSYFIFFAWLILYCSNISSAEGNTSNTVSYLDTSGQRIAYDIQSRSNSDILQQDEQFKENTPWNQDNWPIMLETPFNFDQGIGRPIIFDFDNDSEKEIVFCLGVDIYHAEVYVYSSDGDLEEGWPIRLDGTLTGSGGTNAIGDVDGDGSQELIIALKVFVPGQGYHGRIYVVGNDASYRNWDVDALYYMTRPAIANIDLSPDGTEEIVVTTEDKLYVFNGRGEVFAGFPAHLNQNVYSDSGGATLGDIDNDNDTEIVVLGSYGDIYVYNQYGVQENSSSLPGILFCAPLLGDIDGDGYLEIIIMENNNGYIYVLDHTLSIKEGWPFIPQPGNIGIAVSLGDVTSDPGLEIITYNHNGFLYVLKSDGSVAHGWPVRLNMFMSMRSGITVGDVDNDGMQEIAVCKPEQIAILEGDGGFLARCPYTYAAPRNNSFSEVLIEDVDSDGGVDLVLSDSYYVLNQPGLHYVNLIGLPFNFNPNNNWPVYQHDYKRTGCY